MKEQETSAAESSAPVSSTPSATGAATPSPGAAGAPDPASEASSAPSSSRPAPSGDAPGGPEHPTTGAPPKGSSGGAFPTVGDLFAMLGLILGFQVLVGLLGSFLQAFGTASGSGTVDPEHLGRFNAIVYGLSMGLALAGLLYYRHRRGGRGRWARFSARGLNPAVLLWGFVLICASGVVLEPLLSRLPDGSVDVGRGGWTLVMLVLLAPLLEELMCRGVVLESLRSRYGVTVAWLVSSLFFGVMHLVPVSVVNGIVVGLILGYVYLSTSSLWSVMILHALNNAVAYLMLITGHAHTLLTDLIPNRVLYVVVYLFAVALLVVSGRMMFVALRRLKEGDKKAGAA